MGAFVRFGEKPKGSTRWTAARWQSATAVLLFAAAASNALGQIAPDGDPSHRLVRQSAMALGGVDRLNAVRNITLEGYGQILWQDLELSASPHVPQKLEQLSDLHRVYDIEHERYQGSERGFVLAPLLAKNAYNFTVNDERLDGDIAYDAITANRFVGPLGSRRLPAIGADVGGNFPAGAHMRRMWMMNNPVALVRNLMNSATTLSAPRVEDKYLVLDVKLKQGDILSVGFFSPSPDCEGLCAYLPAFVRWGVPSQDLGEEFFTTWFTGYESVDGLMLPLGYDTHLDYHDLEWFKMWANHYDINTDIQDLAAPPDIRTAPVPADYQLRPITAEKVADHIWRLAPNGTSVIEFKDHLTLFELDANPLQAKAIIDYARNLVPSKPVTQLIVSHEHFDHASGVREAVAEGLVIIAARANNEPIRTMANHPDPDYPDDLALSPKPLDFIGVDEKLVISDSTMTLWLLWVRNNTHMADAIVAYAPAQKVIMEADVATAAYLWQFWPDNFRDIIDYYHLDVVKDSPVHSVDPAHPGVLTIQQVDELLKGGTQRARELCADEQAKGIYLAGCPVRSKRY